MFFHKIEQMSLQCFLRKTLLKEIVINLLCKVNKICVDKSIGDHIFA